MMLELLHLVLQFAISRIFFRFLVMAIIQLHHKALKLGDLGTMCSVILWNCYKWSAGFCTIYCNLAKWFTLLGHCASIELWL